ncbi:ABC transporter ATP-binding protein [Mesorhizobium sp. CU2]|uniref:ABC transporter ATP-binding protein n=1 Tax=unclassified Mesorhizobium TaxID=325217 RepID=UPI00112C53C4|nr:MULTISPECIES: ABC transporter ATP-binding protein [unclassified Mesorhizobium]TPN80846.1 ABC transporter ATP-binding protein [Mesorhizobium sp. CU3]TPO12530.1 ABC transporter ATP-binding protein [Mesorhizobium sp. CU2]
MTTAPHLADPNAAGRKLLDVSGIEVVYGGAILAVADVSLTISGGEIVALLGANGAGKSTVLKAISGLAAADRASVRRGHIRFDGEDIVGTPANRLAARGIVHVLEGRHVFAHLTVEENLLAGAFLHRPDRAEIKRQLDDIYAWFPRLREKRRTLAGLTSGGEQQMLAIGRALLTRPRLVLLDEPSMGLAPRIVQEIFEIIVRLNREKGTAFMLAEQNAALSLAHASRAYVLEGGRVALEGNASDLAARDDLHRFYLGYGAPAAIQAG